ncbi:MAG TPA: VWA domain-containing protein [Hyphomicrobiaceae bacterium]|nr:VWA domain-containing protein [Hyphomicrobiaceae bacterium]
MRNLAGILVACLVASAPGLARAADAPSVMIVFDGSGSMWGPMEGMRQPKYALVRDLLQQSLAKVNPAARVGIASFGRRRGGDCNDAEVMLTPEPLNVERVMSQLSQLSPRGRGPLTLALREAQKAFSAESGPRSIVLIHDDADNCQQDVCAAAAELQQAQITVQVVGLALKPGDIAAMACLPKTTGGQLLNATSADQVGARIEEALQLASRAVPEPSEAGGTGPAPAGQAGAPGLYLRALLAPNTEPVNWPLHWKVSREGDEVALFDSRATNPVVKAPPGRYAVQAADGAVSASETFEVSDTAPTPGVVTLNAGTLTIRVLAQKSGAALTGAMVSVNAAGAAAEPRHALPSGPLVAAFRGAQGQAVLPAGRYVVHARYGNVQADRAVVVPAGSRGRLDVTLDGALVRLGLAGPQGAEGSESVLFTVLEDDPDAHSGRREVARSAAARPEFFLPPNTYYITARRGGAEVHDQIAVGPGDVVERLLPLVAGRLTLSTAIVGMPSSPSEPISYKLERIDVSPPELAAITSRSAPSLILSAGLYRISGRYGAANAGLVREVEVRAGEERRVILEYAPASLKLRLPASAAPAGDVFWKIRDAKGGTVWTTTAATPSVVLQPGSYEVSAETREEKYKKSLELQAGEQRELDMTGS